MRRIENSINSFQNKILSILSRSIFAQSLSLRSFPEMYGGNWNRDLETMMRAPHSIALLHRLTLRAKFRAIIALEFLYWTFQY